MTTRHERQVQKGKEKVRWCAREKGGVNNRLDDGYKVYIVKNRKISASGIVKININLIISME